MEKIITIQGEFSSTSPSVSYRLRMSALLMSNDLKRSGVIDDIRLYQRRILLVKVFKEHHSLVGSEASLGVAFA